MDNTSQDRLPLTDRQLQMLALAAAGMTNAQIGARLHLSVSTVGNTLRTVYEKLDVPNRVLAVRWLIEHSEEA